MSVMMSVTRSAAWIAALAALAGCAGVAHTRPPEALAPALPRPGAARIPPVPRGPPGSLASPDLFVRHCSLLL